jgi:hypothetical protein
MRAVPVRSQKTEALGTMAEGIRVIDDPTQLHRIIFFQPAFGCRNDRCEVTL